MRKLTRSTILAASAVLFLGAASAASAAITFTHSNGVVTGISFDQPLALTTSASYNYYGFQLRIFSLYPETTGFSVGSIPAANLAVNVAGTNNTLAFFDPVSFHNLDNTPGGSLIFDIGRNGNFTWTAGDVVTFSGSTAVSGNLAVPTTGTYMAHIISQQDSSDLATPVPVSVVGVIPEPSTTVLFGGCVIAGLLVRRRKA